MTKQTSSKKLPRIIVILAVAFCVGLLLAGSGFAFAATQETHDPFCASCHTQPETTFYQREGTQASDLASYHTTQQTRCIDCHSGKGVVGRLSAELMGAGNAFKFYTHTAVQPAVVIYPIGDDHCLKCHQNVTQRGFTPIENLTVTTGGFGREGRGEARNNHWHENLARWQATDKNAGNCLSCHSGHGTDGDPQNGFMNSATVQSVCDACHQVLRREREGGGG